MAKGLRKPKDDSKEVEAAKKKLAEDTEKEKEQLKKTSAEVEVSTKSSANPASDKEVKDAEEVKVDDVFDRIAANEAVTEETKVEVEPVKKGNPNVRIKPNADIKTFIGDKWYNLKKGKQETVPSTVKATLQRAGLLDAL